ncbi:hypothetical protein Patl1_07554 [Pistacia atlantica]|uniref:Uncharacterized protein n=1 Tax=Pistacia atlantica TaxID=434234 RepID=A0ACC1AFP6_9ROSI|nr:hypothetical protein Patl1_07554 [Pistacia atlantica]
MFVLMQFVFHSQCSTENPKPRLSQWHLHFPFRDHPRWRIPPSDIQYKLNYAYLCASIKKSCLASFKDLLSQLNKTSKSNVPAVTCIVSDYIMSFTLKAAQELNIPNVLSWTASACGFMD